MASLLAKHCRTHPSHPTPFQPVSSFSYCSAQPHPSQCRSRISIPAASGTQTPPVPHSALLEQAVKDYVNIPAAGRACTAPIPPWNAKETKLKQLQPGMWVLSQDFAVTLRNHAFVFTLQDGSLLLFNPFSLTEEAQQLLKLLPGQIQHIIMPNLSPEHWYYLPEWANLYPHATYWVPPGLLEGKGLSSLLGGPERMRLFKQSARNLHIIDNGYPEQLNGQVGFSIFTESLGLMHEVTVHVPQYSAILMTDMAFGGFDDPIMNGDMKGWFAGPYNLGAKMTRINKQLGSPFTYMTKDYMGQEAKEWYQRVMSWEFNKVLCTHLTPEILNGKAEFERAFDYMESL